MADLMMKFFVPGVSDAQAEVAYQALFEAAKDQLRTTITPKRIYSLRYLHDKRRLRAVVGEVHPEHPRYKILAILESQPYIVMTQGPDGKHGPTIMINSAEITEAIEFEA
jgi:hypothetical protein